MNLFYDMCGRAVNKTNQCLLEYTYFKYTIFVTFYTLSLHYDLHEILYTIKALPFLTRFT